MAEEAATFNCFSLSSFDYYYGDGNLTLPTTVRGASVVWNSSDPAVLSSAGVVTPPVYPASTAMVTLTGSFSLSGSVATKACTVYIDATQQSDQQMVNAAVAALTWSSISSEPITAVTLPLNLPIYAGNGMSDFWTSSDDSTISTYGLVTQPSAATGSKTVTLTATIASSLLSQTVSFTVIVPALLK